MARFPRTEPTITELASLMAAGLESASDAYPNPPVAAGALGALLDAFKEAVSAVTAAEAEVRKRRATKRQALTKLKRAMRADLRYAEFAARKAPEKLTQLGWGPRRSRRPLKHPGEVRNIRITGEGKTWIALAWMAPEDGGAPIAYAIERRKAERGSWKPVVTVMDTKHRLVDQPRGVELSYRVIAMNNAGRGAPSATVTAVL